MRGTRISPEARTAIQYAQQWLLTRKGTIATVLAFEDPNVGALVNNCQVVVTLEVDATRYSFVVLLQRVSGTWQVQSLENHQKKGKCAMNTKSVSSFVSVTARNLRVFGTEEWGFIGFVWSGSSRWKSTPIKVEGSDWQALVAEMELVAGGYYQGRRPTVEKYLPAIRAAQPPQFRFHHACPNCGSTQIGYNMSAVGCGCRDCGWVGLTKDAAYAFIVNEEFGDRKFEIADLAEVPITEIEEAAADRFKHQQIYRFWSFIVSKRGEYLEDGTRYFVRFRTSDDLSARNAIPWSAPLVTLGFEHILETGLLERWARSLGAVD